MALELFVVTSGFFALLAQRDTHHQAARRWLWKAAAEKCRLITTDYVLDETATLLMARGERGLAGDFFDYLFQSKACRVLCTDEERFSQVRTFFLKHADQPWSFTDCLSFCVMKELRLTEALTSDQHFEHAGLTALLR